MADNDPFVLCVDLDGVVADYEAAFRAVVAAECGVDPASIGPQVSWDFADSGWPIRDRDHFLELHQKAVEEHSMFATMPMIEGASDALWRLSDKGVWVRIVTHRFTNKGGHAVAASDTVRWLQEARPDGRPRIPYRDLCFIGTKSHVSGHCLVDDAPHNIEQWREGGQGRPGGDAIVFDTGYNRDLPGPRAYDWTDVEALVEAKQAWLAANPFGSELTVAEL